MGSEGLSSGEDAVEGDDRGRRAGAASGRCGGGGFHGLHVTGGLIAFLLIIGRSFTAKRYTHAQATGAVVTSYYWHFVDIVWVALFAVIYLIQ